MSDLIRREDAIKAVNRAKAEGMTECPTYYLGTVPSANRPQGWIPTSVRMPSENGKYLCCWQGKSVETGMFLNGHFRLYGEIKDNLVTAWMPLPKPWKGAEL